MWTTTTTLQAQTIGSCRILHISSMLSRRKWVSVYSVSVYSARLRHLAATCNFGEFLNRSLRDQFVCGIRNPATRKKLLSEDRTFQEALRVAIADEIAAKETLQVQQQQLPQPVNSVAKEFSSLPSSSRGKSATQSTSRPSPNQISSISQPAASYACFRAVILIMWDLNANLGMLFVAIASYEDILLECVRKVE